MSEGSEDEYNFYGDYPVGMIHAAVDFVRESRRGNRHWYYSNTILRQIKECESMKDVLQKVTNLEFVSDSLRSYMHVCDSEDLYPVEYAYDVIQVYFQKKGVCSEQNWAYRLEFSE